MVSGDPKSRTLVLTAEHRSNIERTFVKQRPASVLAVTLFFLKKEHLCIRILNVHL